MEHRQDVVVRRTRYDLRKAQERAHILEGLIIASDNIDEVVRLIRASKNPQAAIEALMNRFALDEIQAKAIVDMRLAQLTNIAAGRTPRGIRRNRTPHCLLRTDSQ